MKTMSLSGALCAVALMSAVPVAAQETQVSESIEVESTDTTEAAPTAEARCELHVWPTENYLGVKMGLFSGFGIIGAAIDQAGHAKGVRTVKDLMRDYLGPQVQLEELEKLDYLAKLGLDASEYRVIVEEPTPWNEDLKGNKELKAQVKAMNAKIKKGQRLTESDNPCYAELITTHIFYHKAMMYGSNLFTGWHFRQFEGDTVVTQGKGQVKNPLEEFPPKDETMVETAKIELRDAYSKDFVEWVEKKSGT